MHSSPALARVLKQRLPSGLGAFGRSVLMNILALFALVAIVITGCDKSPEAPTGARASDEWEQMLGFPSELAVKPRIVEVSRKAKTRTVELTNTGDEPLIYLGVDENNFQEWIEIDEKGMWLPETWDWCGFGKEEQNLQPGKTVRFTMRLDHSPKRERILICLTGQRTKQSELVELACE